MDNSNNKNVLYQGTGEYSLQVESVEAAITNLLDGRLLDGQDLEGMDYATMRREARRICDAAGVDNVTLAIEQLQLLTRRSIYEVSPRCAEILFQCQLIDERGELTEDGLRLRESRLYALMDAARVSSHVGTRNVPAPALVETVRRPVNALWRRLLNFFRVGRS